MRGKCIPEPNALVSGQGTRPAGPLFVDGPPGLPQLASTCLTYPCTYAIIRLKGAGNSDLFGMQDLCLPLEAERCTVETIVLQIDEATLERARQLAESRQCTLEELIEDMLKQAGMTEEDTDPLLGMFAQEPELIDQVVALAMSAREEHPLRHSDE